MSTPTYDKRHARSVLAATALAKHRFATLAGGYAGPSDDVAGVTEADVAAGRLVSLITGFSALVEAAGVITAGQRVGPAGDGSGRAVAGGAAGVALSSATTAGQVVEVEVRLGSGLSTAEVQATQALRFNRASRVLVLGDSLLMYGFRYYTGISVASASGNDVVLTHADTAAADGDQVRLYNQASDIKFINGTVIENNGATIRVRFPIAVDGLVTGSTGYVISGDQLDIGVTLYAQGLLAKRGKFVEFLNYANGGSTTSQLISMLPFLPAPNTYDAVLHMSGINDLTNTDDASAIIANLERLYSYFLDRGKPIIAGTVWPVMSGDARDTAPKIAAIKTINAFIRDRVASEPLMALWDGYAALKDPATEYALTGYLRAADVHQLVLGAQVAGKALAMNAGAVFARTGVPDAQSAAAFRYRNPRWIGENLVTNPEFVGSGGSSSGGTWSGPVPDGWVGQQTGGTTTLATAARADGNGNKLQLTKAATGANDTFFYQDLTDRLLPGMRCVMGLDYQTLLANTGAYFRYYLALTVNGVQQRHFGAFNGLSYAAGGRVPTVGEEYHFAALPFTIPEGTTAVALYVNINNGASGSTQVEVAAPYVYECR